MRICQEEIFGPVVSVIPFETFDDALAIANGVKYGLSASIYTRNVNDAFRAQRDLETGIVYVNAPTIGAETHLPFGGIKNTGNGHRESGDRRARFLLRVEDALHRLLRPPAARPNRQRLIGGLVFSRGTACRARSSHGKHRAIARKSSSRKNTRGHLSTRTGFPRAYLNLFWIASARRVRIKLSYVSQS